MSIKLIAGNWKMNTSLEEANQLIDEIIKNLEDGELSAEKKVAIIPPFPFIDLVLNKIKTIPNFYVGAQDCSPFDNGAYTGDVSAKMLKSLGVEYCIIGHSERRLHHQETNLTLSEKVEQALNNDIRPIFCCGENLEIREANQHIEFILKQLYDGLFFLPKEKIVKTIIAYEPIWAIGTGKTATSQQAQEMHAAIRNEISKNYGAEIGTYFTILYGGSCNAKNAAELFACPDVDGGLIGGASLNAADFLKIIKSLPKK